jgi:imidazolonepropionase-like amidohydrolase
MAKNGMSPTLAIRSATVDAAELLGVSARLGTIAPGKEADIIAVAGDPTNDVRLLENVGFVMKRGKLIKLDGKPQLTAAD